MDRQIREAQHRGDLARAASLRLRAGESFYNLSVEERAAYFQQELQRHPDADKLAVSIHRQTWGAGDIYMHPRDNIHSPYRFSVWNEDSASWWDKATLLAKTVQEPQRAKEHPKMCCPLAQREFCVCEIRYTCDLHGGACVGSHD